LRYIARYCAALALYSAAQRILKSKSAAQKILVARAIALRYFNSNYAGFLRPKGRICTGQLDILLKKMEIRKNFQNNHL
jgi:hypothetical protein